MLKIQIRRFALRVAGGFLELRSDSGAMKKRQSGVLEQFLAQTLVFGV
jgi:hypothetical protein